MAGLKRIQAGSLSWTMLGIPVLSFWTRSASMGSITVLVGPQEFETYPD